jgi:hypothetical protein
MSPLYINGYIIATFEYYVIYLCQYDLEIVEHAHKYFGDFYHFIF